MPDFSKLDADAITANLDAFLVGGAKNCGHQPNERYTSFDYCFNYFQDFYAGGQTYLLADEKNIQESCLQLAFYLASWGMLRGSSTLLQKSAKFYENLIGFIASAPQELWRIDVDGYTPEAIEMLLDCRRNIGLALTPCTVTDTLATKIMLGVFANVPAFDSYFKYGFGVSTFGRKALNKIRDFYFQNRAIIDHHRPYTIDFVTGQLTRRQYTRAKVIDMIFFIQGS